MLDESRPGLVIDRLREGRARWKRKCQATKEALQVQRVRIRDLQASRDRWREVAEQAQREREQLQADLDRVTAARSADDKKSNGTVGNEGTVENEGTVAVISPPTASLAGHQFPLAQIQFLIEKLVLTARTSLRGCVRICDVVAELFGVAWETPLHTTARTWLLRIGLYQLTRPKPQADDWVWLVDHTLQIGQENVWSCWGSD